MDVARPTQRRFAWPTATHVREPPGRTSQPRRRGLSAPARTRWPGASHAASLRNTESPSRHAHHTQPRKRQPTRTEPPSSASTSQRAGASTTRSSGGPPEADSEKTPTCAMSPSSPSPMPGRNRLEACTASRAAPTTPPPTRSCTPTLGKNMHTHLHHGRCANTLWKLSRMPHLDAKCWSPFRCHARSTPAGRSRSHVNSTWRCRSPKHNRDARRPHRVPLLPRSLLERDGGSTYHARRMLAGASPLNRHIYPVPRWYKKSWPKACRRLTYATCLTYVIRREFSRKHFRNNHNSLPKWPGIGRVQAMMLPAQTNHSANDGAPCHVLPRIGHQGPVRV